MNLFQKFNDRKKTKIKEINDLVLEIIEMCNSAIYDYDMDSSKSEIINSIIGFEENGAFSYYSQVKNIVLPEMMEIQKGLSSGQFRIGKIVRLKSSYCITDSWNPGAKFSKLISRLSNLV
ncbi:hypothetical protein CI105_08370 [Candidatus Izimaplasma bacterium ZiA1]|uniref:hypothetical protein n=1 Tax=Candidatus Izimoplasma sp. ZiA1 TaxID=2024899 RepID=UPI000BAA403E|nr:hypothetical protein CI105_08370 [Candidatus Izimaplasma bacterium ZiA1]